MVAPMADLALTLASARNRMKRTGCACPFATGHFLCFACLDTNTSLTSMLVETPV